MCTFFQITKEREKKRGRNRKERRWRTRYQRIKRTLPKVLRRRTQITSIIDRKMQPQ
jgi:hypothetical protein